MADTNAVQITGKIVAVEQREWEDTIYRTLVVEIVGGYETKSGWKERMDYAAVDLIKPWSERRDEFVSGARLRIDGRISGNRGKPPRGGVFMKIRPEKMEITSAAPTPSTPPPAQQGPTRGSEVPF